MRKVAVTLPRILEEENGEEQNTEDDECAADESEICRVTDVTEEEFGTNEGDEVDLLFSLLELADWEPFAHHWPPGNPSHSIFSIHHFFTNH